MQSFYFLSLFTLNTAMTLCRYQPGNTDRDIKSDTIRVRKVHMDTFGEWLRQRRIQLKLTHKELADRVGCSVVTIRKVEYDERRPSAQIAELLANSLNIPPEERPTFVRVARGELSVNRLSPVLKPVADSKTPRTNLPVLPTPLIGRQREVEELSQLLCDPQCRLLTLVGPGGIGKTRLAIETASQVQDAFADGAYFVPFTPVNSTRFIVPVIADAVGFTFESSNRADPKTQLFSFLREKQVLLLTDNLEQLLTEPGIELLAELLANAPQVRLLATSRESLGLQYEWVFEVYGLPVPISTYAEGSTQDTSVELFVQRGRRAHVGFNPTPEDYPAIVHVCQLVAGNPLGIELAAAWVRTLSCDEIEREIESGMDFLSISGRDIPARHRSMRAVFDHSWKLLTEEEQGVLLRLSTFQGGFRREAAEQVADATLSVLSTLVTKSLIRRSGAGRFDLHELIQQFAAEYLAERLEEKGAIQMRHGKYYLTYFSQTDERLRSSAQREALAELTAEIDNFRTAWDWAVVHREFALIEQTMRTFFRLYDTRGWFQEGLDTLDSAVDALDMAHGHSPPERTDQVALGHLLGTRSWLAYRLANYDQAQKMLERSLEILRPLNEPHVLVESITYLGRVMEMTGNYARALELYTEGLEIAKAIGDRWFKAVCLTLHTALVGITQSMVKPEITHEQLKSVVADWRLIGDPRLIAFGLDFLSRSALRLGRYDEASAALEENVMLNSSIGFGWGLGTAYRGLAIIAQTQGKHQQAIDMFHKSLDTFTELGGSWWVARVLADMSWSFFALGNDSKAEQTWRESLRIAVNVRGTPVALEALAGLAILQAKRGNNMEYALELLLIVLNHPASFQKTKNRASDLRAELEAQLTPTQIEVIQAQARERTFEAVVEDLLM
jgi:predicted ATPase/transcriptional regulator with XRE-family HTH domain